MPLSLLVWTIVIKCILYSLPKTLILRLQSIQNTAARQAKASAHHQKNIFVRARLNLQ